MRRVNIASPDFAYDSDDPEGFKAGMFRIGELVGASRLGTTVYTLPPGQAVCPYHYECGEEEWLIVLEGVRRFATPTAATSSSRGTPSASRAGLRARTGSRTTPTSPPAC
jgi:uncharacterized cupin superfamily protein